MEKIICLIFLTLISNCWGQWKDCSMEDFSTAIQAFKNKFEVDRENGFSYSISIDSYGNTTSNAKIDSETLNYFFLGKMIFSTNETEDQLLVDSLAIICNKEDSIIYISRGVDQENYLGSNIINNPDIFEKMAVSKSIQNQTIKYSLVSNTPSKLKGMEFWFVENRLQKLILYSGMETNVGSELEPEFDLPRIELVWSNFTPINKSKPFQIKKSSDYIEVKNGQFVPTLNYLDYEIIDIR